MNTFQISKPLLASWEHTDLYWGFFKSIPTTEERLLSDFRGRASIGVPIYRDLVIIDYEAGLDK